MSRIAIITLSSLLLVGLVGAVAFGFVTNWGNKLDQKLAASSKAVQAICNPTDYKDACVKSLATVRTDDPKELVRAAFVSAMAELKEIASNSTILKELEMDPKTAQAVKDCKELFQDAIDDFQRSFDEIGKLDWNQVNSVLENLKIWLSATRTYQETCLDGFENTTGDATVKVRKVLQTAMEMSSNGLAIVNDLSTLFNNLDISSFTGRRLLATYKVNRRLFGDDDGNNVLLPDDEEDRKRRKLLNTVSVVGHGSDDLLLPEWVDGFRRKLLEAPMLTDDLKAKANVVVAQDGSGKYKTIEEAIKEIPRDGKETFIIYIKEGVYNEYLVLYKWMTNVVFVGDGPTKTRITNNKNYADGTKTFKTATLSVLGDFFMAKDIGIENSAGAIKHQAVAFRAQSDKSVFFNCHFDGYQDTLYTHTYRQFYRDCKISGTIDFIFGDAAVFFQNCTFVVRKPLDNQNCIVTAQGRMERHQPTGIIIHKSKFEADPDYYPVRNKNKAYLGRPWKEYSKTIIMESEIGDLIQPEGWLPWEGNFGLDTSYYGEYNNVGDGARLTNRVKWRGVKTIVHTRAEKFMPPILYENDDWIRASGIPYDPALTGVAPGPGASGFDEDPNAPAGAPSSFIDESSSSGTSSSGSSSSSSHGSSSSSGSSSKKESKGSSSSSSSSGSSSSSSSGTSSNDGSSSSSSSGTSSNHGSSSSSSSGTSSNNGSSSSQSSSQGSSADSSSSNEGGAQSSSGTSSDSSSSSSTSTPATGTGDASEVSSSVTPAPAPAPSLLETELATPSPTPTTTPTLPPISAEDTTVQDTTTSITPTQGTTAQDTTSSITPTQGTTAQDTTSSIPTQGTTAQDTTSSTPTKDTTSSTPPSGGSSPSPAGVKVRIGPVTVRELERILMENEDMDEDEGANDDMSGNVPDGDEPSPAQVQPPSPAPSSSPSPSPTDGPSEEISDWLPPTGAPEAEDEADKEAPVVSPPPKHNSGSKSKFELHVIFGGMVMWAALFI